MAGKKKRSEAEKTAQRARTAANKVRTQERIAKRLQAAKARRERKLKNGSGNRKPAENTERDSVS